MTAKKVEKASNVAVCLISLESYGRFIGIEVKIGKDRQSADQKEIEREINDAGGVYFIAKSYDDYLNKIAEHDTRKP